MDNLSNTGMYMMKSSGMMMGSKSVLEQLTVNSTGIESKYHWYIKMLGMTMDFDETVTKWKPPNLKEYMV